MKIVAVLIALSVGGCGLSQPVIGGITEGSRLLVGAVSDAFGDPTPGPSEGPQPVGPTTP